MSKLPRLLASLALVAPLAAQTDIPASYVWLHSHLDTSRVNRPIDIDYHVPSDSLIYSYNYSNGTPEVFGRLTPDGSRSSFTGLRGFYDEIHMTAIRQPLGGFTVGDIFAGNGRAGEIVRISQDGQVIENPWVTLRSPTTGYVGLLRGGFTHDETGIFGHDLIVTTTSGHVFRIDSQGTATQVFYGGFHVEGVTVMPEDPRYGPLAGRILVAANSQRMLYAIDATGSYQRWNLPVPHIHNLAIVRPDQALYLVCYGRFKHHCLPAATFDGMAGELLMVMEFGGGLFRARWDPNGSGGSPGAGGIVMDRFVPDAGSDPEIIAEAVQWERANFAPTSVAPFPRCTIATGDHYVVQAGQRLQFDVQALEYDPAETVSLAVTGLPSGATLPLPAAANQITAPFDWTPTRSQIGAHRIQLDVTDSAGLPTRKIVHVEVVWNLFRIDGDAPGAALPGQVTTLGDLDGDGCDDFALAEELDDTAGAEAGRVRLVSGRTQAVLRKLLGAQPGDRFGARVAAVGDVDGDGIPDLAVGAAAQAPAAGFVRVHSGADGSVLHILTGSSAQDAAWIPGRAGDLDADGYDDVLVGAPGETAGGLAGAGVVRVFSGRDGALLLQLGGGTTDGGFGAVATSVGDVDGDGRDDLAITEPRSTLALPGRVLIHSGRDGSPLLTLTGPTNGDGFGLALAPLGDVDGDGVPDLGIGCAQGPGGTARPIPRGESRVVSLATGSTLFTVEGTMPASSAGIATANAGDVDGDGVDDLLVGEPQPLEGSARVVSGRDGAPLLTLHGSHPFDAFGSLATGGDFNGDGFADALVGAPGDDATGADAGSVTAWSLGGTGNPATVRPHGAGCPGSNGHLPRIDWTGRPFLGASFRVALRGALPSTPAILLLGAPTDDDLTAFGLPGCTRYATTDGFVVPFTTDADGRTTTPSLTVPAAPALVGLPLVGQWLCMDTTANAAGYTLSGSARFTFGN